MVGGVTVLTTEIRSQSLVVLAVDISFGYKSIHSSYPPPPSPPLLLRSIPHSYIRIYVLFSRTIEFKIVIICIFGGGLCVICFYFYAIPVEYTELNFVYFHQKIIKKKYEKKLSGKQ